MHALALLPPLTSCSELHQTIILIWSSPFDEPMRVRKELLCHHSEYFRKLLDGAASSSTPIMFNLPLSKVQTFQLALQWMETNTLGWTSDGTEPLSVRELMSLYGFTVCCGVRLLRNSIIDALYSGMSCGQDSAVGSHMTLQSITHMWCPNPCWFPNPVLRIAEQVSDTSTLYNYLVDCVVFARVAFPSESGQTHDAIRQFRRTDAVVSTFFLRIMLRAADLLGRLSIDAHGKDMTVSHYTTLARTVDVEAAGRLLVDVLEPISSLLISVLRDQFLFGEPVSDFFDVANLCRYHEHESEEEASSCAKEYNERYHGNPVWRTIF